MVKEHYMIDQIIIIIFNIILIIFYEYFMNILCLFNSILEVAGKR
jgi:hypothetical protein